WFTCASRGGHGELSLHVSLLPGIGCAILNRKNVNPAREASEVSAVAFERIERQGPHPVRGQLDVYALPDVALVRRAIYSTVRILASHHLVGIGGIDHARVKSPRRQAAAFSLPAAPAVCRAKDILIGADDYQLRVARILSYRFHRNVSRAAVDMLPTGSAVERHEQTLFGPCTDLSGRVFVSGHREHSPGCLVA